MNKALLCVVRSSKTRSFSTGFGLAVATIGLVLLTSLSGAPASADMSANPAASTPVSAGSVTHGHVFLYSTQGPVDVTSMLCTSNGQTYLVNGSGAVPVYISYTSGAVWDSSGAIIGYVDLAL